MKKLKNTVTLFKNGAFIRVRFTGNSNENRGIRRIYTDNNKERKQTKAKNIEDEKE